MNCRLTGMHTARCHCHQLVLFDIKSYLMTTNIIQLYHYKISSYSYTSMHVCSHNTRQWHVE